MTGVLCRAACAGVMLGVLPASLAAHDRLVQPGEVWRAWNLDPLILPALLLLGGGYALGVRRLWREAGVGRGIARGQAACFAAGWASLVAALVSPLDALSNVLFSVHMVQHALLLLAAPPLLLLGTPVPAFYWALPRSARRGTAARSIARALGALPETLARRPLLAWIAASIALWAWHIPTLYDAAVRVDWLHKLEHASFFFTALLFWWGIIAARGALRRSPGAALLYVFTAAMQSVLLGALLTLSAQPWYSAHRETAAAWGLTPLEDQQIAGAVMWVPAGIVYLVAMLAMLALWLRAAERAAERTDAGRRAMSSLLVLVAILLSACGGGERADAADPDTAAPPAITGDPEAGHAAIQRYGCGACHVIPGVRTARGLTGPPLEHWSRRGFIAGALPNTEDNLTLFIRDPWAVEPGTVMPDMGVSDDEARDIAAYLLTIR